MGHVPSILIALCLGSMISLKSKISANKVKKPVTISCVLLLPQPKQSSTSANYERTNDWETINNKGNLLVNENIERKDF